MRLEPTRQLLIVAASGRALAQSARRGGWAPLVIDAFADRDTRAAGAHCLPVSCGDAGVDPEAVLARLRQVPRDIGIVYGGGLEAAPELVDALAGHGQLYGNEAAILRAVGDPDNFFGLLRAHGIPYPVTCRQRQAGPGWLRKRAASCGGEHVQPSSIVSPLDDPGVYYQRYVEGRPMSALFLADRRSARVIGFNGQWTACENHQLPFRYGGAVSRAPLSLLYAAQIEEWVGILARELGLCGLNGLDFIATEDGPLVIELNPRPCATFELYDPDLRHGLLALHVQTCTGRLQKQIPWRRCRTRGHGVLYARRAVRIPSRLHWPVWARDLPPAGHWIEPGEPVCSVHADAENERLARRAVRERQAMIWDCLCETRESA